MSRGDQAGDRRIERSRGAILTAFRDLFFEHGYESVEVRDVADRANVGRSTFYKHFHSKEDLLVQSLKPFLDLLAEATVATSEPEPLRLVPDHFWQNRRFARVVFSGRSLALITRALAEEIKRRLQFMDARTPQALPPALIAAQIAAGAMALLDEWLRGRGTATPRQVAAALHRSSRAIVAELTAVE